MQYHDPHQLPSSVEKIRSLNENEYEALIDTMSALVTMLARLGMDWQAYQVQQARDYIVERRMRIKP